jgi:hypothetical protein
LRSHAFLLYSRKHTTPHVGPYSGMYLSTTNNRSENQRGMREAVAQDETPNEEAILYRQRTERIPSLPTGRGARPFQSRFGKTNCLKLSMEAVSTNDGP